MPVIRRRSGSWNTTGTPSAVKRTSSSQMTRCSAHVRANAGSVCSAWTAIPSLSGPARCAWISSIPTSFGPAGGEPVNNPWPSREDPGLGGS